MKSLRGLVVIDPALASVLLSPRERASVPLSEALTAREVEVLQFLAEGLANKVIAQRLSEERVEVPETEGGDRQVPAQR